jgi:hypothetical protein
MRAHREFHKAKDSAETVPASLLNEQQLSISQSMFMGVSQTLPALLGKSWLALMRNRDQLERLAANPGLMGSATIELLRYAGIVHTLYRVAMSDVEIGSVRIAKGERASGLEGRVGKLRSREIRGSICTGFETAATDSAQSRLWNSRLRGRRDGARGICSSDARLSCGAACAYRESARALDG